jgi:hypothetical protein
VIQWRKIASSIRVKKSIEEIYKDAIGNDFVKHILKDKNGNIKDWHWRPCPPKGKKNASMIQIEPIYF